MTSYQKDFVENLKFYRNEKDISQAKLAELCNCSTGTIGCIESFRQMPSFELLFTIADALKIHPADLFIRNTSKTNIDLKNTLESKLSSDIKDIINKYL